MATFVDTNVAVYAHDHGSTDKRAIAQRILLETADLVVSTQVLAEFYWVVTRRFEPPIPPARALAATKQLAALPVVATDASLVLLAVDTSQRHQLSLWDGLIVEAAIRGGCERLLTEDLGDGRRIRSLVVENPFR